MVKRLRMEDFEETFKLVEEFFSLPSALRAVGGSVDRQKLGLLVIHYLTNPEALGLGWFEDGKMTGCIGVDIYIGAVNNLQFAEDRVLYAPNGGYLELLEGAKNWSIEKGCYMLRINAHGSRNNEALSRLLEMKGAPLVSYVNGYKL
jgi:hypothetical protein